MGNDTTPGTSYVVDFLLGGINITSLQIQEVCATLGSMQATRYRYRYNGKEQLSRFGGRYDYGFRMYDAGLARFLSVDPLTKKYPELTPYQFASNTPIQAIDLDGLEAFFVHGTWSNPSTFSKVSKQTITSITGNTEGATFKWSGNNTDVARQIASRQLAEHIMKNRDMSQTLTIVGHSHGGNVSILAANILKGKGYQVDNLITFNTPVREYQLNAGAASKHISIYHDSDPIQTHGGNSMTLSSVTLNAFQMPFSLPIVLPKISSDGSTPYISGEFGAASSIFQGASNIRLNYNPDFHNSHNADIASWLPKVKYALNPGRPPLFRQPNQKGVSADKTRVSK